jgi:hypothetical protein
VVPASEPLGMRYVRCRQDNTASLDQRRGLTAVPVAGVSNASPEW